MAAARGKLDLQDRRHRTVTALVTSPHRPPMLRSIPDDVQALAPADLTAVPPAARSREVLTARLARQPAPRQGRGRLTPALRRGLAEVAAERQVASMLTTLGPAWLVLHAVPTAPDAWTDHVLIGPTGVWVVETAASRAERVTVIGHQVRAGSRPTGHVRAVERGVASVQDRLSAASGVALTSGVVPTVRGVVAFVGARAVTAAGLPRGVSVVRAEALLGTVTGRPTVLSRIDATRLADAASSLDTWSDPLP